VNAETPSGQDARGHQAVAGLSRANLTGLVTVTVATAAMAAMLGRVVQLQVRPPQRLLETVGTRVSVRPEEPVRGDIMDRRGRVLCTTRFGYRIVVDPTLLERDRLAEFKKGKVSLDQIIVELSSSAGLSPGDLGRTLSEAMRENDRRRDLLKAASQEEAAQAVEDDLPPVPVYVDPAGGGAPVAVEDPRLAVSTLTEEELTAVVKLKRPLRYLPLTGVLTDAQAAAVRSLAFPGVTLERVPVREYPGGTTVAPLVGRLGVDANGTVGLEKALAKDLSGQAGAVRYVRDAAGRPLWIGPGDVTPAIHGSDIKLSIDLEIQRIAQEELFRGINEYESAGGRCVVCDPSTGEILAMVDLVRPVPDAIDYPFVPVGNKPSPGAPEYVPDRRYKVIKDDPARRVHPALGHNRCVESVYEPGSTFKSFVWSTITELGKMHPSDVVNTENGYWITSYGREIKDVKARATQTWTDVLINSSNIGMGKGAERLSFAQLHDAVKRFGFGQKTGIGLPGEATGLVTSLGDWKITSQHSVAFGNEVAVTPLQMVRAYSAFARPGEMAGTIPRLRIVAGDPESTEGDVVYRVLPSRVALLTRDAMTHVAENMETTLANTSKEEKAWRYAIFGKSGTSKIPVGKPPAGMRLPHGVRGYIDKQYYSSFLSGGPTENPRLVTLVIIDDPSPKLTHSNRAYGALTAGPVNRRIMERALTYLGVPPSPGHEPPEPPPAPRISAPAEDAIPPTDAPELPEEGEDAMAGTPDPDGR
jgi:cell division protein FtsI (penicillin-binding protein 3)